MNKEGDQKTLIPLWDGRHESWSHFLAEIKWTLTSMKKDERPLLAARIVRKNLQEGPPPLVQLLYKLDPEDFGDVEDVERLIRFLEASPLNRQPLPDAGTKIGQYYRRLRRKPQESVRQFLVREEQVHDMMLRSLQRLLREKELDFDNYDCSIEELKEFVGMKDGASVYYDDASSETSKASGATAAPGQKAGSTGRGQKGEDASSHDSSSHVPRTRGKDLLQRLMEKGLIPLSALDVIRGWMLLEMCVNSDEDKRLVKAATRNKLSYNEIRQALMSLYDEQGQRGKGFGGSQRDIYAMQHDYGNDDWHGDYHDEMDDDMIYYQGLDSSSWETPYHDWDDWSWGNLDWASGHWPNEEAEEASPEEQGEVSEEVKALIEEREHAEQQHAELQAMLADNERTLAEARKAVSAATKDRGWGGVQQGKGRSTTTYPGKGKGKSKFKNKNELHWMKGSKDRYPSRPNFKGGGKYFMGSGKGKNFSKKGSHFYMSMIDFPELQVDHHEVNMVKGNQAEAQAKGDQIASTEGIIDTGATASAGGQDAVTQLCAAIAKARPSAHISVIKNDKPWFRYGSGRWGRALYRVNIEVPVDQHIIEFDVFALPSENVPVLVGMRELKKLGAILGCDTSRGIVMGKCVEFRRTSKQHLLMNFLEHVFPRSASDPEPDREVYLSLSSSPLDLCFHDNFVLDLDLPEEITHEHVLHFQEPSSEQPWTHLGMNIDQWNFMMKGSSVSGSKIPVEVQSRSFVSSSSATHVEPGRERSKAQGNGERGSERSDCRDHGGSAKGQGPIQEDSDCRARPCSYHGSRSAGPKEQQEAVALLRNPSPLGIRKQVRSLDRVREMRLQTGLHPESHSTSTKHCDQQRGQCERSSQKVGVRWLDQQGCDISASESHDHHSGQGETNLGAQEEEQGLCREHHQGDESRGLQHRSVRLGAECRLLRRGVSQEGEGGKEEPQGAAEGGRSRSSELREDGLNMAAEAATTASVDANWVCWTSEEQAQWKQQLTSAVAQFSLEETFGILYDTVNDTEVWELFCRPNSSLTLACERLKIPSRRKTLEEGYNIEKPEIVKKLLDDFHQQRPRRCWWSLRCTEWTSIQALNQRNEAQQESLRKKRQKGKKGVKHATTIIIQVLHEDPEVKHYWERPKNAYAGWQLPEMQLLVREMQRLSPDGVFWTQIDGCVFGMKSPDGYFINKSWIILHNDRHFAMECKRKCPGNHEHRPGGMLGMGTNAVHETAYYPEGMVSMIARFWKKQRFKQHRGSLENDIVNVLYQIEDVFAKEQELEVKTSIEDVNPSTVEQTRRLLHKIHCASGHPSNISLSRLCRDKGLPHWVIQLARHHHCEACLAGQRGEQQVRPVSLGTRPQPWQLVGLDLFELPFPKTQKKARFLIAICLAMKLMMVSLTWEGPIGQAGTDSGKHLTHVFINNWLQHRPRPLWLLVDPQTSLCKGDFVDFAQNTGIGISVTPGEAHWQLGGVETAVRTVKNLMKRFRFDFPDLDPATIGALAASMHNHHSRVRGYSPNQWAFGFDPNPEGDLDFVNPMDVNHDRGTVPEQFWHMHKVRDKASSIWKQEKAKETWSKLTNTISRKAHLFQVGDWVCIWRTATFKARKKGPDYSPEPRFVGPGRIAMIEPHVFAGGQSHVIHVIMGTKIWRCAPEQLRLASESEVTWEILGKGSKLSRPVIDQLQQLTGVVDVTKEKPFSFDEPDLPDQPFSAGMPDPDPTFDHAQNPADWEKDMAQMSDEWSQKLDEKRRTARSRSPGRRVHQDALRWTQLISINENRRKDGLPPLMQLPPLPDIPVDPSPEKKQKTMTQYYQLHDPEETYLENKHSTLLQERDDFEKHVLEEAKDEIFLLDMLMAACEEKTEVCEVSFNIENLNLFLQQGLIYTKQMLAGPNKEVTFRNLSPEHKELFREAMAREVSEVLRSQALRAAVGTISDDVIKERLIPMRWVLTWKVVHEDSQPTAATEPTSSTSPTLQNSTYTSSMNTTSTTPHIHNPHNTSLKTSIGTKWQKKEPTVLDSSGQFKAKARIVLLGFKHPDLSRRDPRTGQRKLSTAAPTLSRLGRNLLLQSTALDGHTLESADAKSAFLQAEKRLDGEPLYTKGVPEIALALGLKPGQAMQVLGAIYGLTIAPRLFWLDADQKLRELGGQVHACEKCLWIFTNSSDQIIGRIGSHVDDFLICGNEQDSDWQKIRDGIKKMYSWSPWQKGKFTFAGVELQQLKDGTIWLTQEEYCNSIRPLELESPSTRTSSELLRPQELSQFRGAVMKGQWRSTQSAPQYAARIGLLASTVNKATFSDLQEANRVLKELKKTSKVGMVFHAFNAMRQNKLAWTDIVMLHFGDAGHINRPDGGSTGGYVTGISTPEILEGKESKMSVIDWRSWKLDRPSKGSNGSESQAIYEAEDRGWRCRLMWSLLYGMKLQRGKAEELTAMIESLLIMDSRGVYDATTMSESSFCGMNNARSGVEAMSIQRGVRPESRCYATWVPGDVNLADALTKNTTEAYKVYQLYLDRQSWCVRFDNEFISARKQQKLRRMKAQQDSKLLSAISFHECEDEFWYEDMQMHSISRC